MVVSITSSLSKGVNILLAEGVFVNIGCKAILDRLGIIAQSLSKNPAKGILKGDSPNEQKIRQMIEFGALHFHDIVRKMDKDSKTIGSLLSLMELKSLLRQQTDGMYSLM